MDIRYDVEKNIAVITPTGQLTKEAILGAFDLCVRDKRYVSGMGRLWDFRQADLSRETSRGPGGAPASAPCLPRDGVAGFSPIERQAERLPYNRRRSGP